MVNETITSLYLKRFTVQSQKNVKLLSHDDNFTMISVVDPLVHCCLTVSFKSLHCCCSLGRCAVSPQYSNLSHIFHLVCYFVVINSIESGQDGEIHLEYANLFLSIPFILLGYFLHLWPFFSTPSFLSFFLVGLLTYFSNHSPFFRDHNFVGFNKFPSLMCWCTVIHHHRPQKPTLFQRDGILLVCSVMCAQTRDLLF